MNLNKTPTALKIIGLIVGGLIIMWIIGALTERYGDGIIIVLIYSLGFNIYFLMRTNKKKEEIDVLTKQLRACLQDVNVMLNIINFSFFNHDLRKNKQSILSRSIFSYEEVLKYKWDKLTRKEFSGDDFIDDYNDEDDSLKEYRIEFFRQNIGDKIRIINDRYNFGNQRLLGHEKYETFNISDKKVEIFLRHWDHLLRIDSRNN